MERYIFDLDGTLLKGDWDSQARFFVSELGSSLGERFKTANYELLKIYEKEYLNYDVTTLSEFYKQHGLDIPIEFIYKWQYFNGKILESEKMQDVIDLVLLLKEKQKRLSICSNWFGPSQLDRLERANLTQYFDTFVFGSLANKPHEKAYEASAKYTPFAKCVFIGDNIEYDYNVPISLGMNAYFVGGEDRELVIKKIKKGKEL